MNSIFFDLETSDKNPIGQIINYCFILVNDDFEPIDVLKGLVRISRLQIPSPGAIIANRTDVLEHQALAVDSEAQAMAKIAQFIAKSIEGNTKLPIVGYNSSRFDIPYLRTSFIRNGINPYFSGRIVLRDLLFVSRKLAVTQSDFPFATGSKDPERVSYSLENLCQQFNLLTGLQSHESEADVLLTISLAKVFHQRYRTDVRSFDPFEAFSDQTKPSRGLVRMMLQPVYDPASPVRSHAIPMVLLDFDYRSSLWIDLRRYKEQGDRSAIFWFNHTGGHQFVIGDQEPLTPDEREVVRSALEKLSEITLKNFFEPTTCDIEQDIYRLDFDGIAALEAAIWRGNADQLKRTPNRDARVLFKRYQLAAYPSDTPLTNALSKSLEQYAEYRYLGSAQLAKSVPEGISDEKRKAAFHPSIGEIFNEIAQCKMKNAEDAKLMESLEKFITSSDIFNLLSRKHKAS